MPTDVPALLAALDGVPASTDRALVRQKSRDFYWYSPILKGMLDGKAADLLVTPRDEAEVLRVLTACRAAGVPITPRGAGTGNYGQCVPMEGGIVLDMTAMTACRGIEGGIAELEPGVRMLDADLWARERGWELRLWPSTKRTATVGGFVAGGGAGVGGLSHGTLKERGNLHSVRVATLEDPPRILDLEGDEAAPVNRTYGTTGVLTLIRLPLTPAQDWRDVALTFEDFSAAGRFAMALAHADGIPKKMCALFDPRLPPFFREIADVVPAGHTLVVASVALSALRAVADLAREHGTRIVAEQDTVEAERDPKRTPFYEYCWNHTTLQVLKRDRGFTYLQMRFPMDDPWPTVERARAAFPDDLWLHLECNRFGGRFAFTCLPVVKWSGPERLAEIMAGLEAMGVSIANPHVITIEDGSAYRRVDGDQLGFKRMADPLGLLNPGKMRSFTKVAA
ncbi:FAD-binding oxidoreductase [Roseomonas sp. CCTCC AB2023176]|uniref:FAD-binding oxidoreductase n=1 Tax=Roseomonas sp. CCTCC AB2023176 TaxID=3342640 RepID=UPI0035E03D04